MLKFFDPTGRMGRTAYFKSTIVRSILFWILVFLINTLLFPDLFTDSNSLADQDSSLYSSADFSTFINDLLNSGDLPRTSQQIAAGLVGLAVLAPIEIRRANDLHMNIKWLIPKYVAAFIPVQVFLTLALSASGAWISILWLIYIWLIELVLLFRPGQVFKEWIRAK